MNLYKISQSINSDYDTFDSAIVCAATKEDASLINPGGEWRRQFSPWCEFPEQVEVELIGVAFDKIPVGVVLASFNAA